MYRPLVGPLVFLGSVQACGYVEFDAQFLTVIHSNSGGSVTLYQPGDQVAIHLPEEYCRVYRR